MSKAREVYRRYALALLRLGAEHQTIASLKKELSLIDRLFSDPKIEELFHNPLIANREKSDALLKSLPSLSKELQRFILLVAKKNRLVVFPNIVQEALLEIEKREGIGRAQVWSASPLTDREKKNLTTLLKKKEQIDYKIDYRTDPNLIGGFRIIREDHVIDCTIRHQLDQLKKRLIAS